MTANTREITLQAPKTGPWIVGYALSIGAISTAAAMGIVTSPATAAPFWIPIIICTIMMIYTSWKRHRLLGDFSDAVRKFWTRFVLSAAFMFLSYCLLAYGQMADDWGANSLRIAALLPAIGFAGMVWSVHQYVVDEDDEYLRTRAIRQLLIASFTALIGAIIWSSLATAEIVETAGIGLVTLFWFGGLGVGRIYNEAKP